MLGNLQVLVVGAVAWWLLGERPATRLLAAVPVLLVGVALVSGALGGETYGANPRLGVALGFATSAAYAGFILLLRHGSGDLRRLAGPLLHATASAAVCSLVLGLVLVVLAVVPRQSFDTVRVVDVDGALERARASEPYDVVGPVGLTAQWRAASARLQTGADGATWRIGYVTPEDDFAVVAQSDRPAEVFVTEESRGGGPDGSQAIGGADWQRLGGAEGDRRTLWHAAGDSTILVTGTASYDELAELASSLRPG